MGARGTATAEEALAAEAQRRVEELYRDLVPKREAYFTALSAYNEAWRECHRAGNFFTVGAAQ